MWIIGFFDRHEGFGVALGVLASLIVAIVAVVVPYLQRRIDGKASMMGLRYSRVLAFSAALDGLSLLMAFQGEAFERQRSGGGAIKAPTWDFDLRAAEERVRMALAQDLRDPVITAHLMAVQLWLGDARQYDPVAKPSEALSWSQTHMAKRQQVEAQLRKMLTKTMEEIGDAK